jgi:hypothetical protein
MMSSNAVYDRAYQKGVYNPPVSLRNNFLEFESIKVDLSTDWMRFVIGKNGSVFKAITERSGAEYIWYKKETNTIELWGTRASLLFAAKLLQEHLKLVRILSRTHNIVNVSDCGIPIKSEDLKGLKEYYQLERVAYLPNENTISLFGISERVQAALYAIEQRTYMGRDIRHRRTMWESIRANANASANTV